MEMLRLMRITSVSVVVEQVVLCVQHLLTTAQKKIYITDVFEESSKALVEDINKNFAPVAEFCPAGDFSKVKEATVVLNASGIGMGSHIGENPLPKEFISKDQFYFDACYNPAKTQFLLDAEKLEATIFKWSWNVSLSGGSD